MNTAQQTSLSSLQTQLQELHDALATERQANKKLKSQLTQTQHELNADRVKAAFARQTRETDPEMLSIAWNSFRSDYANGKDPDEFVAHVLKKSPSIRKYLTGELDSANQPQAQPQRDLSGAKLIPRSKLSDASWLKRNGITTQDIRKGQAKVISDAEYATLHPNQ